MEQLSLFESENNLLLGFEVFTCDENWKLKTQDINGAEGIVISEKRILTKTQLKELCRKNVRELKPAVYAYRVFFEEKGYKRELTVRLGNYTTSKRRTVFEHIDLFFDNVALFNQSDGRAGAFGNVIFSRLTHVLTHKKSHSVSAE